MCICILTATGCKKDSLMVTTGIIGTVKYGQGDCMPSPDPISRQYQNYTGNVFFVLKEDWDNTDNGDFELLKNKSIHIHIKQGKLSMNLPVGTYLVIPEDVYVYSNANTISIRSGEILNKDFSFFKCTSY